MAEQIKQFIQATLADENKLTQESNLAFDEFDTDVSGGINRSELKACFDKMAQETGIQELATESQITDILNNMDFNNDGTLDRDEFRELTKILLGAILEEL